MNEQSEAELTFEHWYYEFKEEDFQNTSPNRSITDIKASLHNALKDAYKKYSTSIPILIDEDQILCSNEFFPEAAVADPLSDLRIWDEWRSGARVFPYVGEYTRLSITNQPGKIGSTTSIGVIGEIFAGLLGQAIISPEILIRVIRRWPDFIFYPVDGRYSFLEAKAFSSREGSLDEKFQVPRDSLAEGLFNAVRQLAIDPTIKIWYSFTEIKSITPRLMLHTHLFELEAPVERRENKVAIVPIAVVDGIAERAIQMGISKLLKMNQFDIQSFSIRNPGAKRKSAISALTKISREQLESALKYINYADILNIDLKQLENSLGMQVKNLKIHDVEADAAYLLPSSSEGFDKFEVIRKIGNQFIFNEKLSYEKREENFKKWNSNYILVNSPYKKIGDQLFWRFGGFLFFLCDGRESTLSSLANPKKNDE